MTSVFFSLLQDSLVVLAIIDAFPLLLQELAEMVRAKQNAKGSAESGTAKAT